LSPSFRQVIANCTQILNYITFDHDNIEILSFMTYDMAV